MPSQKEYNNLKYAVKNLTLQRASLRAKQREDISNGLYYKNGLLLNNVRGGMDNKRNNSFQRRLRNIQRSATEFQNLDNPTLDDVLEALDLIDDNTDDLNDDDMMGSRLVWNGSPIFVDDYYNILRDLEDELEAENEESEEEPGSTPRKASAR